MMTIFNRTVLYGTHSAEEKERICRCLGDGGIEFSLKLINRTNVANRAQLGAGLDRPALDVEYRIYVYKEDLEAALHAVK